MKLKLWVTLASLLLISANVLSQSFVLTMDGYYMNFLESNRTCLVDAGNGGKNAGSVHRYDNLIVKDGLTIYGKLTILQTVNASIGTYFDYDNPDNGLPGRFQPYITTTAPDGYVLYELEFYEVITDARVYVSDYYLTGMDIDGQETYEIGGYSSYEVDATCGLTISYDPVKRLTKFVGISGSLAGLTFENTAAFVARYNFPYTKVQFAFGNKTAVANRQFSGQFGTVGGVFTNPYQTWNPMKLIAVTKTANTNEFKAGTNNKYTIKLENVGGVAKNVTLSDVLPAGITYVPNSTSIYIPSANVIETVIDHFNLVPQSYSLNNGSVLWASNWIEADDDNSPTAGRIQISGNRLYFNALTTAAQSIRRAVDLSMAQSATLEFDYQTNNMGAEVLSVELSTDGGFNYTPISGNTITGTIGSTHFNYTVPSEYFTSNTIIRFISSTGAWTAGQAYIDNVKFSYFYTQPAETRTNAPGTLTNGVPPNVLVDADNITLHPNITATVEFDVSTDCNAAGTISNTAVVSCTDMYTSNVEATHSANADPTTTGAERCNPGVVTLTAHGASPDQDYKWYDAPSGGTLLQTNGDTYSPNISATTDYYVSFYNTTTLCESGRTKVTGTISNGAPTGTAVITSPTAQNGAVTNIGNTNPNAAVNNTDAGTIAWTNLGNVYTSNNARATATNMAANTYSNYIDISGFGFAIPVGSQIVGITARVERMAATANRVYDNVIQLLVSGSAVGDNLSAGAVWPTTEGYATYGSATTTWGRTWTAAEINNIGVRIQCRREATVANVTASIDHVTLAIAYKGYGDDQGSVNFVVSGVSGATAYTWTPPTGASITNGQGTSSVYMDFNNAGQNGAYQVCVTPSNGCASAATTCKDIRITDNANYEISGNVYYDPDGSVAPNKVDGTPISSIGGQQLYVTLAEGGTPTTVFSREVSADGTYKFSYLKNTANNYSVYISTTVFGAGTTPSASLPAGASWAGEINNNAANTLTGNDGNTNGIITPLTAGNETNVNFGIMVTNPVAVNDAVTINEDNMATVNVTTNDTDPDGINVATVDLNPSVAGRQTSISNADGDWSVDDLGVVTFTPLANAFGTYTLNYTVKDNAGFTSNEATITVTVNSVNDAPSFTKGADQNICATAGAQSITNWATSLSKGPSNESLQTLTFYLSNDNNSIFAVQPAVSSSGTLTFTPSPSSSGTALVTIYVKDNGGTANGGVDQSANQTFSITVEAAPAAPTGIASQTFCNSATIADLSATGSNIKWYDAATGGNLYNAGDALTNGNHYYATQTVGGCESNSRLDVTVDINPTTVGGSVTGGSTICYNTTSDELLLLGQTGSITKWQYSFDGSTWTDVAHTSTSYTSDPLTQTTQFRAVVKSGVCNSENSSSTTVTVLDEFSAGAITGEASATQCYNYDPAVMTANPTGGSGTYTYQWQSSADGSSWGDISGATNNTYNPGALTTTTHYRVLVDPTGSPDCGGATASTNTIVFTILSNFSAGAITGEASATQCYNYDPAVMTANPTGGSGTYTYQWQSSADGSSWGDISGATNNTYNPGALTTTTHYRVLVDPTGSPDCGGATASTNTIVFTINPASVGGSISGVAAICSGESSGLLTLTGETGSVIKWQSSTNGTDWNDIANTNTTYTSGALTQTTQFRAVVQSGTCASANSSAHTITVNAIPSAPTGNATQTFCTGNNPKVSDLTASGSNIKWYNAAAAGSVFASNTPLVNGATYYASQTVSGCESSSRLSVTATILTCTGPDIANATITIDENTPNGTEVYDINDENSGVDKNDDGDDLTYSIISQSVAGAFAINASTGAITVADATKLDYETITSFTITVRASDGANTDDAVITVNLNNLNDSAPVSVADSYTLDEGAVLNIAAPGVLGNDSDADGNPLTAHLVSNVSNGSLTLNADGSFTYTHNGGETTTDAFTYRAHDGVNYGNTVTVSLTINPVNDAPVFAEDTLRVPTPAGRDTTINLCSNVSDAEGHALTITIECAPKHGTFVNTGDGCKFKYTPDAGFTGTDTLCYEVCDNGTPVKCKKAYLVFTITPGSAPVSVADSYTLDEGAVLNIAAPGVLGNDSDADGNPLTAHLVSNVSNGSLTLNADGSFTYTHNGGETTTDAFTYRAHDGVNYGNTVTVSLTINPVNDAPVFAEDTLRIPTPAGKDTVINLCSNVSDAEGNALTISIECAPKHGSFVNTGDGCRFKYTPDAGFTGTDTLCYEVCDNGTPVKCKKAYLVFTITPGSAPVSVADSYTLDEGAVLNIAAPGVLGNDSDADGNPLTAHLVSNVSNGSLTLNADGSFTYTHNGGETTTDAFTYRAHDGVNYGNTVTVSLTINPVNDAPVFAEDTLYVTTLEDEPVVIDLCAQLGDPEGGDLAVSVLCEPGSGALALSGCVLTYTPSPNFFGADTLCLVVCDSGSPALCDTAYVVVSVTGVNDPPTIASDTLRVTTLEDEPVVIDLCAQLGDPEGGDLAVSVLCEPGSGALALSGCVLTYTPSPNFFGADTLCLVVCDSGSPALCDTAVVVITISPINDLPIAVNDNYTVNRGGTLTILSPGVLINDSDVDSDLLTSIKVTDPSHGALTLNDDGSFTYIHDGSKTSSDSFTYKVNDGSADGNTVTVSITILPVNEMPIAVNDINSLDEGQIDVIGNILSNDYDPDGDPLSVISIDGNTNISTGISGDYGTLTCNSLGNYTYTLNNQSELAKSLKDGETLIERFDYSISDGNGGNANAVLEITIHGKNNDTGIVISEGFSPDGDGKGDNFIINGIENYPDNELVVYNRWGTKVYQKKGYNNEWDGRSSVTHAILPVGTYYYILTIKEKNSTYKGYVYLKY